MCFVWIVGGSGTSGPGRARCRLVLILVSRAGWFRYCCEFIYSGRDLPLNQKQTEQSHKSLVRDMFRPRVGHHQSYTLLCACAKKPSLAAANTCIYRAGIVRSGPGSVFHLCTKVVSNAPGVFFHPSRLHWYSSRCPPSFLPIFRATRCVASRITLGTDSFCLSERSLKQKIACCASMALVR